MIIIPNLANFQKLQYLAKIVEFGKFFSQDFQNLAANFFTIQLNKLRIYS